MKPTTPIQWTKITVSSAPWNYRCGFCRTDYMGVADSEASASRWGEGHESTCVPEPLLARSGP